MKPSVLATEHKPAIAVELALDSDDRKHDGLAGVHGASPPTSLEMISRSLASATFKISNWD